MMILWLKISSWFFVFIQVYQLLAKAAKNRSVARTLMNEQSSRSHSVFRLSIVGKNTITGLKRLNKF